MKVLKALVDITIITLWVLLISCLLNLQPVADSRSIAPHPTVCPQDCKCETNQFSLHYDCKNGGYKSIEKVVRAEIEYLELRDNNLTKIPRELSDFSRLKHLTLSNNKIKTIDIKILNKTSLEILDLSNNLLELSSSDLNEVLSLKYLKKLILTSNNVYGFFGRHVPDGKLYSESIEYVDVSNCSIVGMRSTNDFYGLKNLKFLNLSGNPISYFNELESYSLEVLDISNCQLVHLRADCFLHAISLETLIFDNNPNLRIQPMTPVGYAMSLTIKTIQGNNCSLGLTFIPNFPRLKNLSMSRNFVPLIGVKSFHYNMELTIVNLSHVGLQHVSPLAFDPLVILTTLDLSDNLIQELPVTLFKSNKHLIELILRRNRFEIVPELVSPSLLSLDLEDCNIKTINKDSFLNMPKLKKLILKNNPIKKLPSVWISYQLTSLDLSNCLLSKIDQRNLIYLDNLEILKLDGNMLKDGLNPVVFPKTLKHLSLMNNPWECDCKSKTFYQFYNYLTEGPEPISVYAELICHTPKNVTNKTWYFACSNKWNNSKFGEPSLPQPDHGMWYFVLSVVATSVSLYTCVMIAKNWNPESESYNFMRVRNCRTELENRTERLNIINEARQRQIAQQIAQQNAREAQENLQLPTYEQAVVMGNSNRNSCKSTNDVQIQTEEHIYENAEVTNNITDDRPETDLSDDDIFPPPPSPICSDPTTDRNYIFEPGQTGVCETEL